MQSDTRPLPAWYAAAKLGIFVHWGLYSIPAFADSDDATFAGFTADLSSGVDIRGRNPYAEWYLNGLRIPGSPTAWHHAATYGQDFSYFDFRPEFDESARRADLGDWAGLFADVGAEYVVMVSRHLDGYPLWPTGVPHPTMPADFHAARDLVGDLTAAVRRRGLRMGLYYAGGVDWTFTDKPIRTMTDLMDQSALGPEYARYAAAHWRELIERYQPSVLWNDMGWPAEVDPHEIVVDYYDQVPDGVVNDRWTQVRLPPAGRGRQLYLGFVGLALRFLHTIGKQMPPPPTCYADFRTYEYTLPDEQPDTAWELTRGLGDSFGFNAAETATDLLTGTELVRLFVDVVARGGNLLLNVGPDGAGRIPEVHQRPLRELGAWMKVNAEAIHASRPFPWAGPSTVAGTPVRFTRRDDNVYAIVCADELTGSVLLPNLTLPNGSRAHLLGSDGELTWTVRGTDVEVRVPEVRGQPAYVVAFTAS